MKIYRPLVSVIIPTVKNDPYIKKNLEHINNSTYKNIEIIVVDEGRERSYQRNFGIKKSTGDFILYLDSDQFVSKELIQECVTLTRYRWPALYIPEIITSKGFFAYLRNWERQFYTGTPIDCVRFMKKEHCPLFDESLNGPEDSCHDRRVITNRLVTENPLYHEDNVTFWKFLSKKAYYSKSMKHFSEKYPGDKVLDFWWRCFGVYFENGKWKRVLKRPDLFILVMGLIFLRGVVFLCNR